MKKSQFVSLVLIVGLMLGIASPSQGIFARSLSSDDPVSAPAISAPSEGLAAPRRQEGEPGDPVVTGDLGLSATVQVFPYDVDLYGIYLVQGDQASLVTSVPVEHINLDRVTAKLSPDGYKVAYLVEFGSTGFSRLVVVGADGLNSNALFESLEAGRYVTSFSWSHDSDRLAYALSRDPFVEGTDVAASFENPEAEIDPLDETALLDDPSAFSGEVWVTDLYGTEQEQLVDNSALDVLGWAGDDNGVLFTSAYTETAEMQASDTVTSERAITLTTPFAGYVALVQTDAITTAEVTRLFTNTAVLDGTAEEPLYTDFYLLETATDAQKLAAISTTEFFETVPMSDTTLLLTDLSSTTQQIAAGELTLTPVLTNTSAIVNVQLSPDGTHLAYMTEQTGGLWAAATTGLDHTALITQGLDTRAGLIWGSSNDALGAMSADSYSLSVFTLAGSDLGGLSVLPSDEMLAEPLSAYDVKNLNVPFIHQLWDTPDWFYGRCACGPTSTAMALAFYNKISPNPITISAPTPHTNNYGFYVPEKFGSFQSSGTPGGCPAGYGLYGSIVYDGAAWAYRIRNAVGVFGINTTFDDSVTYAEVKAAIDRGHLVILSTRLTSAGHIILVRGYTSDGKLIVNDPYGDKTANSYGQRRIDGANARYAWNYMNAEGKWFVEVQGTPPTTPITHWKGEYYNNRDLSGQLALIRNDTNVDFDWGSNSPNSSIPADNFSVRWTRTLNFERGTYRFRTTTDDGVRLYVDNRRVIDKWYDQGATTHESQDIFLDGGNHTIKMEYYERGGAAVAKLSWQRVGSGSSGSGWYGEYYNNRGLSGSPTFTRNDDSVYFNWGGSGPGSGVGNDNFSVRWTKTLAVPRSGYYRFYARADDGVRVWVDGRLRISGWRDQAATTYSSSWLYLGAGNHSVKTEYYENGGDAYIRLWMTPVFYGQFYKNRSLSGSPSYTSYYNNVDFNWWWGGPSNTSSNNFSARWTGYAALSGGRYKFCTRTDDGVRLYIDGTRVIDKWQDQGATTYCTDRTLSKDFHEIKMEYYENGGVASAHLWWSKYSGSEALSASTMILEDATEFDIWALYGDSGYLGPLVEDDITSLTVAPGEALFIPLVLRQP